MSLKARSTTVWGLGTVIAEDAGQGALHLHSHFTYPIPRYSAEFRAAMGTASQLSSEPGPSYLPMEEAGTKLPTTTPTKHQKAAFPTGSFIQPFKRGSGDQTPSPCAQNYIVLQAPCDWHRFSNCTTQATGIYPHCFNNPRKVTKKPLLSWSHLISSAGT